MATERIKITPSNITIRDASSNILFDTDRKYLKTGSGTLYSGGNTRSPMVTGQNSIGDHTEFGYFLPIYSNQVNFNAAVTDTTWFILPKCDSYSLVFNPTSADNSEPYYNYTTSARNMKYYNYNTETTITLPNQFYWHLGLVNGSTFMAYPVAINGWPAITNGAGGSLGFPWTANEHTIGLTNTVSGTDSYGNIVTSVYSLTTYLGGNPVLKPMGFMINRSPVALSLAVTA